MIDEKGFDYALGLVKKALPTADVQAYHTDLLRMFWARFRVLPSCFIQRLSLKAMFHEIDGEFSKVQLHVQVDNDEGVATTAFAVTYVKGASTDAIETLTKPTEDASSEAGPVIEGLDKWCLGILQDPSAQFALIGDGKGMTGEDYHIILDVDQEVLNDITAWEDTTGDGIGSDSF